MKKKSDMKKGNSNRPKILVTGGAGFIGSHTTVELWNAGYEPVIVDNFSNSKKWVVVSIRELTSSGIRCYDVDCCDQTNMRKVFEREGQFYGIIHFAAYKSVSESVDQPELYYSNNIGALKCIMELKEEFGIPDLIFSSSATVYGDVKNLPVTENAPLGAASSPYGVTKQLGEELLLDAFETGAIILRYFNPIGAHPSGLLGELPAGTPQNLVPFITQTAIGKRKALKVFGTDYNTSDGTCIRDYIHVVDLARAHLSALGRLLVDRKTDIFNVGTGRGYSVKEVVETFQKVNGITLPVIYDARREGDVEAVYADCTKANQLLLNWRAEYSLDDALMHAWKWEIRLAEGIDLAA